MFEKKEKKKKFLQSRNKVETLCLSVCLSGDESASTDAQERFVRRKDWSV